MTTLTATTTILLWSVLVAPGPAAPDAAAGTKTQKSAAATVASRRSQQVADLVKRLEDNDPDVRSSAARGIGRLGPSAETAIPALVRLLRDPVADVRMAAVEALADVGATPESAVPDLLLLLADADSGADLQAVRALRRMGPRAAAGVPDLIRLLQHESPRVQAAAAEVLGAIGPQANAAVPALLSVLKKDHEEAGDAAAEALARMWPVSEPGLAKLAEDDDASVRGQGFSAMRKAGPQALPDLLRCLRWAPSSIHDMRSAGKAAVPQLLRLIEDRDSDLLRQEARGCDPSTRRNDRLWLCVALLSLIHIVCQPHWAEAAV